MSSLAAARADNFYHPPDWDPRKESRAAHSLKATGGPAWKAHPLRERAKKLDQGILVIRFEMPFDVRCSGCGCRIGKGVRFDAEKKAVGKYLSTKIWSFRMLCKAEQEGNAQCDQKRNPHFIEVRTDPKNAEYLVTEGAQVLFQSSATAAEYGVEAILDPVELTAESNAVWAVPALGPAPPRGRTGSSRRLVTKGRGRGHWSPSHRLGRRSSEPPPKPLIPPRFDEARSWRRARPTRSTSSKRTRRSRLRPRRARRGRWRRACRSR